MKAFVKRIVYSSPVLYAVYGKYRKFLQFKRNLIFNGTFENRSKGSRNLCILLAGYKPYLYEAVIGRLRKYQIPDLDICVVSSGLYSQELSEICRKNNWSYMSLKRNNVSLALNFAIRKHKAAENIFKMDEDIFLTAGFFEKMFAAYQHAQTKNCDLGVIAPLILVNGYSYVTILEKYHLIEDYASRFEKPVRAIHLQIETNPETAKYMWGEGSGLPTIDVINAQLGSEPQNESVCSIQFSIGAIMFHRELWAKMGMFTVTKLKTGGMGLDEEQLCEYCKKSSRPLMVSNNILVGHMSFGPQNDEMKKYFHLHKELFMPEE